MLLQHGAIYFVGRILPALITLAMMTIYSRVLTAADYGLFALVNSGVMIAFNFTLQWLCGTVLRLDPETQDRAAFRLAVLTIFGVVLLAAAIGCLVVAVGVEGVQSRILIFLGFMIFAFTGWLELNLSFLMTELKAGLYGRVNTVRTASSAVLGISFALVGWGVSGVLTGAAIGLLLPSARMSFINREALRGWWPDKKMVQSILTYGFPLGLGLLLYGVVSNADRQLLGVLDGAAAVGLYAVGFDLADRIISAIMSPIGSAGLPLAIKAFESRGAPGAERQLSQNVVLLFLVGLPASVGLSLVGPSLAHLLLGAEFRDSAARIVPIVAVSSFLAGVRAFFLDHIFQLGRKTGRMGVVMAVTATAAIAMNWWLIPLYGLFGAAYATLSAHAIGVCAGIALGRGILRVRPPIMDLAKIAAATAAMAVVVSAMSSDILWLSICLKTMVGVVAYALVLLAGNFGDAWRRTAALIR
jgi:O-antigen/teichoic acid export membrane protein